MLLVSANVNGIRAAARRGGLAWLEAAAPDVVTLQEVRADDDQLRTALSDTAFAHWHVAHARCGTKGRAGVAVLSRLAPLAVRTDLADEFAGAGRWVEADVPAARCSPATSTSPTGWRIDHQIASRAPRGHGGAGRGRPGRVARPAVERPRPGVGDLRGVTRLSRRGGRRRPR